MPELALYDHQANAFTGHFDGVRVAELLWGEPPSNAGLGGSSA